MPSENNRHFEDGGDQYARYRPTYPEELGVALASMAPSKSLVLDVGCGNGQLSVLLASHFEKVVASDVSEDQIKNVTHAPNIQYHVGPAEKLSAEDASVSLVTAAQAAHWFDRPAFFRETKRVLQSDGVLALITYGVPEVEGKGAERIEFFYRNETHLFWPSARVHVEKGYRDFAFPFDEIETPSLTIERTWSAAEFINYCRTWSAIRRAQAKGHGHILQKFEKDLHEMMTDDDSLLVTWPITIRAGRVKR